METNMHDGHSATCFCCKWFRVTITPNYSEWTPSYTYCECSNVDDDCCGVFEDLHEGIQKAATCPGFEGI